VVRNRSAPPFSVVPVLTYPDVPAAVSWLTTVFGFVEHVRIDDHRAQLSFDEGAIIVADATHGRGAPADDAPLTHSTMVRVHDIDAHCRTAEAAGARIISAPDDLPFGERQYVAVDLAGHHWTFTETVADRAPEDWGGVTVEPWPPPLK
jgi:uncharacterized glyoxalase superfamily protein PhnB